MRILYLLSTLDYKGAAKEACMLARGLAASCDLRVCALHQEEPWAASLRRLAWRMRCLDWTRPLDPRPLWRLRRLLGELRPDMIHVWRLPALRALALAGPGYVPRCIVSQPKARPWREGQVSLGMLDRGLLRRVKVIAVRSAWEAACLERLGLGSERIKLMPTGVDVEPLRDETPMAPMAVDRTLAEPPSGRRIVCLGNVESDKGFCEALRAADFLAYRFADLHFYLVGSGPHLPALRRFENGIYHRDRVHLLGRRSDAGAWLSSADVCWVPSTAATGPQVALEAMAAGCAVVASDLPLFREIIVDGVSGLLVRPGDSIGLARLSRELLLNEDWRRRLGEVGRRHVHEHFAAAECIKRWHTLYGLDSLTFARAAMPAPLRISTGTPAIAAT